MQSGPSSSTSLDQIMSPANGTVFGPVLGAIFPCSPDLLCYITNSTAMKKDAGELGVTGTKLQGKLSAKRT